MLPIVLLHVLWRIKRSFTRAETQALLVILGIQTLVTCGILLSASKKENEYLIEIAGLKKKEHNCKTKAVECNDRVSNYRKLLVSKLILFLRIKLEFLWNGCTLLKESELRLVETKQVEGSVRVGEGETTSSMILCPLVCLSCGTLTILFSNCAFYWSCCSHLDLLSVYLKIEWKLLEW